MTYSNDRRDDYANQGQQDDYFDQDLAIAGHEPQTAPPPVSPGDQDDYFDQDLAIAGHELKANALEENQVLEEYKDQGQQDDYFNQDLEKGDRPQTHTQP